MSGGVCSHVCTWPWRSAESAGSPGAGVTGSCELPDVGAGNQTWSFVRATRALNPPHNSPALVITFEGRKRKGGKYWEFPVILSLHDAIGQNKIAC